jgi:LysM repeat protein
MNIQFTSLKSTFCILLFISLFSGFSAHAEILFQGDSIGVERVGEKTFILHKVTAGETLFSISRRYKAAVGDIQNANESLKDGLKTGQTIRVPFISLANAPEGSSIHKVAAGETLFSISKKYGITIDSLKQWNKLLGNDLSVGQALVVKEINTENSAPVVVLVPVASVPSTTNSTKEKTVATSEKKTESKSKPEPESPKPTPVRESTVEKSPSTSVPIVPGDWISHTVKQGETLFSISSQYNSSVEDLIQWNALTSNNLRSGQVIKVGRAPERPSTVPVIGEPKVATSTTEMRVEPTIENTSGGFKNIKESGQAEVIEGTGGHKKYLVLHRAAPVGSIIRVKNEENDITIFARVVGTLPETGDNSKLVIKLSQAAYDQLRAVNSRFPVEVLY